MGGFRSCGTELRRRGDRSLVPLVVLLLLLLLLLLVVLRRALLVVMVVMVVTLVPPRLLDRRALLNTGVMALPLELGVGREC